MQSSSLVDVYVRCSAAFVR